MVRNDHFFLERWVEYYGLQLGKENLYVLLDGKDQNMPANALSCNIIFFERVEGLVSKADRGRINLLSKEAAKLLTRYDMVIGTDVDEFLILDPKCNQTLSEYLSGINIRTSVSGLGIDVGQHLTFEDAIDKNKPFLSQRSFAVLSSRYTKATIIVKPVQWGAGFHRVKKHNFRIDKNLYLFHFGCVDFEILKQKLGDNDKLLNGWERHLKKRTKTISIVTNKKAKKGDKLINVARLLQTFIRPVFAWNKPTMLNWKPVIEIPERFKKDAIC